MCFPIVSTKCRTRNRSTRKRTPNPKTSFVGVFSLSGKFKWSCAGSRQTSLVILRNIHGYDAFY